MATQILNLPLLSFSMTVGTNEDWVDSLGAYLDPSGNALSFAGLALNFEMRPTAASASAAVIASTAATVAGLTANGSVVVGGAGDNVPALSVPLATMSRVPPGVYVAELQAQGDGLTRTIGSYVVTVVQGIVRVITSAITVLRPTAPGVAPGTALPAGPAGPSAYQVAVAAGFTGTAAQWLTSLAAPAPTTAALNAAAAAALSALIAGLPTSLPQVSGVLWNDGGTLAISS